MFSYMFGTLFALVHLQGVFLLIAAMSSCGYVNIYILAAPKISNMLCGWVVRSATEESQSDNIMLSPQQNGVVSEGLPSRSDTGTEILREGAEQDANIFLGGPVSGDRKNQRMVANGCDYLNTRGSGKDMELALARQAQLIGQYEEEEKAQREWEEKFREHNSSTPVCLVISVVKCGYAIDLA